MHEMQTIVTDDRGVCLSHGSTWLLFEVNNLGGPRNIVLDRGPDPPQRGQGDSMQLSPNYFGLLLRTATMKQCW